MPSDWNLDIAGVPGPVASAGATGPTGPQGVPGVQGNQGPAGPAGSSAPAGGFINKFRNATMDVAQRNTSGSVSAGATAYTLDGWQVSATGAAAAWSQQYNANMSGPCLRIAAASGLTACTLSQRIESNLAAQMLTKNKNNQTVTVQFSIYNAMSIPVQVQISTATPQSRDNWASSTTDIPATNLQQCSMSTVTTVAYTFYPSINMVFGYQINLLFGSGLNAGSGYVDISFADIRVTPGVGTGVNSSPPPIEMRPIQQEVAFCQRYYYDARPDSGNTAFQTWGNAAAAGAQHCQNVTLPVTMCSAITNPTITARGQVYVNASALTLGFLSWNTLQASMSATAAGIFGCNYNFSISCEL